MQAKTIDLINGSNLLKSVIEFIKKYEEQFCQFYNIHETLPFEELKSVHQKICLSFTLDGRVQNIVCSSVSHTLLK